MKWTGSDRQNLLDNDLDELRKLYPELSSNYLSAIKSYHTGKSVVTRNDTFLEDPEGEVKYQSTRVTVRTVNKNFDQLFSPATAATIRPSSVKARKRNSKIILVFSDTQIDFRRLNNNDLLPVHDEQAMSILMKISKDLQPDTIVNTGDTVDLAALSRFKPDSDHFQRTLGPSFQRVHDMYAQLRSNCPAARIVEVDSNHNSRLKNFMLKHVPDMYGVKRPGEKDDYPVFTYPYLANLGKLDVEWISGYGAAQFVYGEEYDKPPIVFKHGITVASNASTASKESKANPETHVVRGHGHRVEQHTRTTRKGDYLVSIQVGALCKTTGEVSSYGSGVDDKNNVVHHQENWQQSIMVIHDNNGTYQFDHIYINKGTAFYNGKEYTA